MWEIAVHLAVAGDVFDGVCFVMSQFLRVFLPTFVHFDYPENQGPTSAPYKISAKYTLSLWRKVHFLGLAIFSNVGHFFLDQA